MHVEGFEFTNGSLCLRSAAFDQTVIEASFTEPDTFRVPDTFQSGAISWYRGFLAG
jgi:hypothetical protein